MENTFILYILKIIFQDQFVNIEKPSRDSEKCLKIQIMKVILVPLPLLWTIFTVKNTILMADIFLFVCLCEQIYSGKFNIELVVKTF